MARQGRAQPYRSPATVANSRRLSAAASFARHFRLTRELEKKFSDRHVVFVAQRRMLRKPTRTSRVKQKRPRSRTLTNVHEKILEDLVFPTEIVGKRTRVNQDGSKLLKVCVPADPVSLLPFRSTCRSFHFSVSQFGVFGIYGNGVALTDSTFIFGIVYRFLDAKDSTSLEYKLDSFSSVYRRLTGKDVVFEFPVQAAQE